MADNVLRIGAEFDVSQIVASSQEAVAAFDELGASVGEASAEMLNALYPTEEAIAESSNKASVALNQEAQSSERAATASMSHAEANIQARLTTDALTGNISRAENALIRFASHSEALAPIMQAAFAPLAVAIFADIIVHAAEKVYNLYENVVLLRDTIKALDAASEAEAQSAAHMNEAYEESYAKRLEMEGKFAEARAEFQKAASDKPLTLPKIDDKVFKQFNSEFVTFLQAVHTSADAPSVITRINAEAESTGKQLEAAKARLKDLSEGGGEELAYGGVVELQRAQEDVDHLAKKYEYLKTAIGEVQSQQGTDANALASSLDSVNKKEDEASKKSIAAWAARVAKTEETHDRFMEMYRQEADAYSKLIVTEAELSEKAAEMFAATDRKDVADAMKSAEEKVKAWQKYTAEVDRLAEESALKQISQRETETVGNLRLEEQQLDSTVTTQYARAAIHEEITSRIVASERAASEEMLAEQLKLADEQKKQLLGGQTEQSFVINANPDQLGKLEQINRQIEADKAAHTAKMADLDRQEVAATNSANQALIANYTKMFDSVNRGILSMTAEVMNGTLRVSEMFRRMGANIVISTVQAVEQATLKWAEHFLIVEILEHSSIARRIAEMIAGESIKRSVQITSAAAEATEQAGIGAAGAFASVLVALPFPINVATAPEVAATQFAAIMAVGLPKAETGAHIPRDMAIFAHAGETVLSPKASQDVGKMASSFNEKGGSGDTHVHMNVNALDSKSVSDFLHSNRAQFTKMIRTSVRNGTRLK